MEKSEKKGCLKIFLAFLFSTIFLLMLIILIGGFIYLNSLPPLEALTPSPLAQTSRVYAIDGTLIAEFHAEENREIIDFDEMSQNIKDAIISVEDKRYYEHRGVDYKRILGALVADIRAGEIVQGGSTITQQYVKNVYFTPEQTLKRKINEAAISIQLERNYTKDKILELYLNTIYFGSGAYGVEKASQVYFGTSAKELTLPQAALLAGLVRAPEIYSPFNNLDKAISRRNLVLKLMYEQGFIESSQYLEALDSPVVLSESGLKDTQDYSDRIAPYFVDYVKQILYEKKFTDYDVFKGGLKIYTTLDLDLQKKAEEAVKVVFPQEIGPSYALISMDPGSGYIYALIGGKDYSESKFNIATQGKRQPGSIFKTLVLMESINQNLSPHTRYNPNGPITIDMQSGPDWVVDNYGGKKYEGEMSVVDATVYSVNVVYAQLMMKVGADNVEGLCSQMEIYDIGDNPAIALGGLEFGITPLDVCKAFSTLASGGYYYEPVIILKITDSVDNVLYEYNPQDSLSNKEILEEPEAYYITQILERVIAEGTGKGASIGRPAAGKTGTTTDNADAWFGGYTPELATVVWMGYEDSNIKMEPINDRTIVGGTYPADIWREYMTRALGGKPVTDFGKPEKELIDVEICTSSNLIPIFWCPVETKEYRIFVEGKEPKDTCNVHNKVEVPDVVGLDWDEALKILENLYFVVEKMEDFDETYQPNIVFKQQPIAGNILESLTGEKLSIVLYVSKGEQTFKMPNLIGLDLDSAEKILNKSGLANINIFYEFSSTQTIDKIFDQYPEPKVPVTRSATVSIYISKGENPEEVVPDVLTLKRDIALDTLESSGFKNITILDEESTEQMDRVFNQVPASGTVYNKASEIIIKISKGIKVPNVVGNDKALAIGELENLGFVIIVYPDSDSPGKVSNQIPEAGIYMNFGSEVSIEIKAEDGSI